MLLLHLSTGDVIMKGLSRREMLKNLGSMIAAGAALPVAARGQARAQGLTALGDALMSLSPAEAATLRAMIARIIPADENGPGALEARADRFIDRALAGALKNQRPAYTAGLAAVDSFAQSSRGSAFAKLSAADQDAILIELQSNRATGFSGGSGSFFNLVRTNTIQGTFSDPFYGGNENFIGWDLIGYPGSRTVVSANLQRIDMKPESSRKSAYDYAMFNKPEF
jgi:gluconate 2-dehydrogenase gamma chain